MGDFAELQVWREPATERALSWYLDVAENREPAKFRVAATVPVTRPWTTRRKRRCGASSRR